MKPDTALLQLTAREFAEMLAWHAKLCQRDDFIDVDKECRKLFGEPEPHQHAWDIIHTGRTLRAMCDCGQVVDTEITGDTRHDTARLTEKMGKYGQAIILK